MYYYKYGKLFLKSVTNKNELQKEEKYFHLNGIPKKEKNYIIGSIEPCSYVKYTKKGKVINVNGISKFVKFKKNRNRVYLNFIGLENKIYDSVVISQVKDFDYSLEDFPTKVIKKQVFKYGKNLKLYLNSLDWKTKKCSFSIIFYKCTKREGKNIECKLQEYKLQFQKAQKIPKNNLYPILLKDG